jgi:uncharacterized protein
MGSIPMAQSLERRLLAWFQPFQSCAVAFSGGVDSAVVAAAAHRGLGENSVAVTGSSASLAAGELELAQQVAAQIGIRHVVMQTREFDDPRYLRNAADRCYYCKTELYDRIAEWPLPIKVEVIVNGANVDDLGDYRPGMQAASQHAVRSPLAECGFSKQDVRALAQYWGLPVWDKPASPCLSSRVAYGEEVTPQRLRMIDESEQFLKSRGFAIVRVRYHRGDMARIEVPAEQIQELFELREYVNEKFTSIGFRYVTIDLDGFRSGNLNELIDKIEIKSQGT